MQPPPAQLVTLHEPLPLQLIVQPPCGQSRLHEPLPTQSSAQPFPLQLVSHEPLPVQEQGCPGLQVVDVASLVVDEQAAVRPTMLASEMKSVMAKRMGSPSRSPSITHSVPRSRPREVPYSWALRAMPGVSHDAIAALRERSRVSRDALYFFAGAGVAGLAGAAAGAAGFAAAAGLGGASCAIISLSLPYVMALTTFLSLSS